MKKSKILIVDDDQTFREAFKDFLIKRNKFVDTAKDGLEGLEMAKSQSYDLIISDLQMPGMDGITLLRHLKNIDETIVVLILTAHSTVEGAVKAMKLGAFDYIEKPWENRKEELEIKIERALEKRDNDLERKLLKKEIQERYSFHNIIGKSKPLLAVFDLIETVAASDITVFIQGETGTGKELVARAIHYNSIRKDKPLIVVNCPAFSETLLESELFGHEKGAFTGAHQQKIGRFEMADKGSIFLDEVGDIPLLTQSKLLRVLQEREIERVGGTMPIKTDVRVIGATNKDLNALVKSGKFREDLFFRLNIFPIHLPRLVERTDDIIILANNFLEKFSNKYSKKILGISDEVATKMLSYPWPGNVRELEHAIETAVLLETKTILTQIAFSGKNVSSDASAYVSEQTIDMAKTMSEVVNDAERWYLLSILKKYHSNIDMSAKQAGVSKRSFYRKMQELKISKDDIANL
ncbi:MAG: sigma-54 dependent transcriptional regulator [Chlamydiota bacterium]|nr:sigma-54 dependent transcriptional regulator [Chlamydiota bacterium]